MKRVIISLLLIAMMVLSTTIAMAEPFTPTGSMNGDGWSWTGTWIRNIQNGAMAETSATASHSVDTGASGAFSLDFNTKVGTVNCKTDLGIITESGKRVTVRYNPADVFFYVYVDGSQVATLGHNNFNPIDNFHTQISSNDGNTYTFKVQGYSTDVAIGSVPGQVYISFDNNGVSSAYDGTRYNVPILYSLDFQSAETPLPVATIDTVAPRPGVAGELVHFVGSATNSPTSYDWDFGDGTEHGSGTSVYHQYQTPNTYTVKFTATNIEGTSDEATTDIVIDAAPIVLPDAPMATIVSIEPLSGDAPLMVTFVGSATNNPISYDWDFGDGSEHGSDATVTHTYDTAGTYPVRFTAINDGGASAVVSKVITVTEPVVIPDPTPVPAAAEHIIDPAAAIAFCQYQIFSPDAVVTYDGKGGYSVNDPRKSNTSTVAAPASSPVLFTVSGQVLSAADNMPISDASVVLDNAVQKTNNNGEFKFTGIKAGKYDLALSADGYVAVTQSVDVVEDKLVSIKLDKLSAGIATSAGAANETANMTAVDGSMAAGNTSGMNATAIPTTARSPGFEFVAVLAAVLIVAGVMFYVRRKE